MFTDRTVRVIGTTLLALCGIALTSVAARADVTVEQQTSLKTGPVQIDINSVERTAQNKQRRDSTTHCHGFLSLFCGNAQDGQIVRLDKQLEWHLQPKKKQYTQHTFPTAEERAQAQQQLEQELEAMKSCRPPPQAQPTAQSSPDTSHCQLSAPTVTVQKSDEHATLAGHDAHKTTVVLSQTCTDAQSGSVCKIDYGFELWLTSDDIQGIAEQRAFQHDYLAAQGLDANNPQLQGAIRQFLAPYGATLRQLQIKAADLQGYPLRTVFYMAVGGPNCAQTKQQAQQQASTQHHGFGFGRLASDAVGGRLSGLFARHGADATTAADAGQVGANAAGQAVESASASSGASGPASGGANSQADASGMVRVISMSTETRSIETTPIAADQFDIPLGWVLQPNPVQTAERGPTCPTDSGH